MLQIQNISFRLGGRALFERATLSIQEGQKSVSSGAMELANHAAEADPRGHHARQWINRNVTPTIIGTVAQEAPAGSGLASRYRFGSGYRA